MAAARQAMAKQSLGQPGAIHQRLDVERSAEFQQRWHFLPCARLIRMLKPSSSGLW
jgi:hypothetical protein